MTRIGNIKLMFFVVGLSISCGALSQPPPPPKPCCWPPPCSCNCEVRVNGKVVKEVQAKDREDCFAQTSFGSENCKRYGSYFGPGINLLEQYFNKTDRVNSDRCKGPEPKVIPGWSGDVKIASIEVSNVNAAGVWVSFTTPPHPTNSCPNKNGQYVLGGGQPNIDKMTELATSALVNSRTVTVYWSGGCSSTYPVLLGLTLK